MSKRVPKYPWAIAREELRSRWHRLCSFKWGRSPYEPDDDGLELVKADLAEVRHFLDRVEAAINRAWMGDERY